MFQFQNFISCGHHRWCWQGIDRDQRNRIESRNKPSCLWSIDLVQMCQGNQWGKDSQFDIQDYKLKPFCTPYAVINSQ